MKTYLLLPLLASCALDPEPGLARDAVLDPELESLESEAPESDAPKLESANLLGSDSCRNTDITITNSYEHDGDAKAIRVQRVEFYSTSEGWTTEDLGNTGMDYGETLTWWNEDLANAEGDEITRWRVYFNYLEYVPGPEIVFWSSLYYMEIDTPNKTCREDAKFSMTVD
jgi:hypothetical protein